jgi:putative transposase
MERSSGKRSRPRVRSARRRLRPAVQTELPFRSWGGKRAGAGRKPKSLRVGVPHRCRPEHKGRHPLHVTMRAARQLPSLRTEALAAGVRREMAKASGSRFRVVHFSVQSDHLHLIIEAEDKVVLSRGMAGLAIRIARSINRRLKRSGIVFGDRYHARTLVTPREVRHAIVYVLMNFKKHIDVVCGVDRLSSAFWFDGWKIRPRMREPPDWNDDEFPPVRQPRTWLARAGWRRHGLIGGDEGPQAR